MAALKNLLLEEYGLLANGPKLTEFMTSFIDQLWRLLLENKEVNLLEVLAACGYDEEGDEEMFLPLCEFLTTKNLLGSYTKLSLDAPNPLKPAAQSTITGSLKTGVCRTSNYSENDLRRLGVEEGEDIYTVVWLILAEKLSDRVAQARKEEAAALEAEEQGKKASVVVAQPEEKTETTPAETPPAEITPVETARAETIPVASETKEHNDDKERQREEPKEVNKEENKDAAPATQIAQPSPTLESAPTEAGASISGEEAAAADTTAGETTDKGSETKGRGRGAKVSAKKMASKATPLSELLANEPEAEKDLPTLEAQKTAETDVAVATSEGAKEGAPSTVTAANPEAPSEQQGKPADKEVSVPPASERKNQASKDLLEKSPLMEDEDLPLSALGAGRSAVPLAGNFGEVYEEEFTEEEGGESLADAVTGRAAANKDNKEGGRKKKAASRPSSEGRAPVALETEDSLASKDAASFPQDEGGAERPSAAAASPAASPETVAARVNIDQSTLDKMRKQKKPNLGPSRSQVILGKTRSAVRNVVLVTIGCAIGATVIYLGIRERNLLNATAEKIEAHYEAPLDGMVLVKKTEADAMKSELATLIAENDELKHERKNAVEIAVQDALQKHQEEVNAREKEAYNRGRDEAVGLSLNTRERVALLSLSKAVINGECDAFGRGNRIDKVFPTNLAVDVLYWMVDPTTLRLSGVVATNQELLTRADGPVTQIRCLVGRADIFPSFGEPTVAADGQARPLDKDGKPLETNPLLQ